MITRLSLSFFLIGTALLAQTPIQNCTVANIRGVPIAGTFCGGASGSLTCSPGSLYTCKAGVAGTQNNCTLAQVCGAGCLEGGAGGVCVAGAPSFTVAPLNTLGGTDLTANVSLPATHHSAIINLRIDRQDLVPGVGCAPPPFADAQTAASFGLSSAVVSAPTPVQLFTDITYIDAAGFQAELISKPQLVTLNPGGHEPPPPTIASYVLEPTSIGPSGIGFARVSLTRMAPASGVLISLTSSNPAIASIIGPGQPFVLGSCFDASVAEAIQATNSVPQTTVVNISASSGAAGQAPLTQPLTVTGGCVPLSCTGGPSCGPQPDGCGGTMNCGCNNANLTCGGGGVAGQCGAPSIGVFAVTMNPSSVAGGGTSIGTVVINPPAPQGGAVVTLASNSSFVTVPASITVPSGATVATFSATTTAVPATGVSATLSATLNNTISAVLSVTPTAVCTPTTCAAQGKICGTTPDGCGGTLTCGGACGSSTATITLVGTGKGGKVTSSPSGLNASSGSTASAAFPIGTSLALTTDNGHGAIWSGLCSSGGKATRSCTFTVSVSGTVTANEQ